MLHRLLQGHRLPLFLPHPEEIRSKDSPQHLFPHLIRDGHGRPRRPPHHGHHPRSHPLHKIQNPAECEDVMNILEDNKNDLSFMGIFAEPYKGNDEQRLCVMQWNSFLFQRGQDRVYKQDARG